MDTKDALVETWGTAPDKTDCARQGCLSDISKKRKAFFGGFRENGSEMWYCNYSCFIKACEE